MEAASRLHLTQALGIQWEVRTKAQKATSTNSPHHKMELMMYIKRVVVTAISLAFLSATFNSLAIRYDDGSGEIYVRSKTQALRPTPGNLQIRTTEGTVSFNDSENSFTYNGTSLNLDDMALAVANGDLNAAVTVRSEISSVLRAKKGIAEQVVDANGNGIADELSQTISPCLQTDIICDEYLQIPERPTTFSRSYTMAGMQMTSYPRPSTITCTLACQEVRDLLDEQPGDMGALALACATIETGVGVAACLLAAYNVIHKFGRMARADRVCHYECTSRPY